MIANLTQEFSTLWPYFVAQIVNLIIVIGLFTIAVRVILARGKGWEVPVWLVLSFFIPIIFPILALIHFRKSRFGEAKA